MQKKLQLKDQESTTVRRLTRTVPPKRGPDPQGLNVPLKQVTTIKLEKLNGRAR